ncbi:MAG: glycerol-3-phosphate 1-O-acyltransferase PlsY [Nitrospirota bacterium]|nr:glycerol-3-phosphate 1-O-acyltransferase PlsY [Nitrospirota bacterium]
MAICLALAGYLIGSIPFGIVVSKVLGLPDPRTVGSKNIGFTNVLRVSGKQAGILTLIGDMGKGWVAGWLASQFLDQEPLILIVATAPILGHLFPVFLGFRGGKGVATAMGAVAGVTPWLGLMLLGTWLVTAAIWRYSSGAALTAFGLLPVGAWIAGRSSTFLIFTVAVSGAIWWKHQDNIKRLLSGTESKIGQSMS